MERPYTSSLRLTGKLVEKLDAIARRQTISRSAVVRQLLTKALAQLEQAAPTKAA